MIRRESVRVAVLDAGGRLLLLRAHGRWELPGTAIGAGEDARDAARRGLREATGIDVQHLGRRVGVIEMERGRETVYLLRLDELPPLTLDAHRWWPADEPLPRVRVHPPHLGSMLDSVR